MIKSELHIIEKFVGSLYEIDSQTDNTDEVFTDKVNFLDAECERLKERWVQELFNPAKDHVISRYVQFHQAGIIRLSDKVSSEIPEIVANKGLSTAKFYGEVVESLEELIAFIQQSFYKYFDADQSISTYGCSRWLKKTGELEVELERLFKISKVADTLREIIRRYFSEITDKAKTKTLTYRQSDLCIFLIQMLNRQLGERSDLGNDDLALELYKKNFNTYYFSNYYIELLSSPIDQSSKPKEKEHQVKQQIKKLQDVYVDTSRFFIPELTSVDQQVITGFLLQHGLDGRTKGNAGRSNGIERMPLHFSVVQFALFIRLVHQEGCFQENNITDLFRFFSQHFTTKKQMNISIKSFRRAFYNVDQHSAAIVLDLLQRMILNLKKTHFPQ